MNEIFYAAGVIGGVVLIVGGFSGRDAPRWTRIALWMCGPACVVWGVLGFGLLWGVRDTYGFVLQFKALSAGIAIGILVLLFASGEFRSSPKRM